MSNKTTSGTGSDRTRNYACVVYADSAPDNWRDILADMHIPLFISPYHDQDLRPDGTPKKPHWHVQFMFDSVKSTSQVEKIIASFNGVGCEVINSCRAYARYLCHLDEHDKHLYPTSDVISLGGANYYDIIGTMSDKISCIRQMKNYIKENNVFYFCDLFDYAEESNSMWFDALVNGCSYIMEKYIKSFTYKYECEQRTNL